MFAFHLYAQTINSQAAAAAHYSGEYYYNECATEYGWMLEMAGIERWIRTVGGQDSFSFFIILITMRITHKIINHDYMYLECVLCIRGL